MAQTIDIFEVCTIHSIIFLIYFNLCCGQHKFSVSNIHINASYKATEENPRAKVGRIFGVGDKDRCYDCYSSDQTIVTGNTNTYAVDGASLSADAFLHEDAYIDFDFENVWVIDPEIGGAVLK